MKKPAFLIILTLLQISCSSLVKKNAIPEDFNEILTAHGGLQKWESYKTIFFTQDSTTHFVTDLKNRRELIKSPEYCIGYDGKNLWVRADTSFTSDPKFLKNLMFYFYTVPFVFADPGINYEYLGVKTVQGRSYEAWKITFAEAIGESPKDEYFLYIDSKTKIVEWLAYTVTYFSGEKAEKLGWIKYNYKQRKEGLKMPDLLTWYATEENLPTIPKSIRHFTSVSLSKNSQGSKFYAPLERARLIP